MSTEPNKCRRCYGTRYVEERSMTGRNTITVPCPLCASPQPSKPQARTAHRCRAHGCQDAVQPHTLMCLRHWRMVPREIQKRVWAAWKQLRKNPTEYQAAVRAACDAVWDAETERAIGDTVREQKGGRDAH